MKLSQENIWLAIALMALLTYLSRSLPFLLSGRSQVFNRLAEPDSLLASLGPCLLMAITGATILPILVFELQAGGGQVVPTCAGLLTTVGVMWKWANVGLAVVAGMLAYAAVFSALGLG